MLGYPRSRQSDVLLWVAWEVFLMATIIERPEIVTVAHLEFLDELRISGDTNMYGAAPYLQREFDIPRDEARVILSYWMKSF